MRAVSDRFLGTLRGSHTAVGRATVCTTFQTGTTPAGTQIDVTGGDVLLSATNTIRSTAQVVTTQEFPRTTTAPLMPYGQELYLEAGIAYGNGQREFVGLGYFRINTPEQEEVPDGPITVHCADRKAGIVDARFTSPRQFAKTLTRGQLVTVLLAEVYPGVVVEWDDAVVRDGLVGRTVIGEEDRAALLDDFVTSLGKIGYFDHRGIYVVKDAPDTDGDPAWTIDAGAGGVMVQMSRSLTRERVYNGVIATGEAADTTPPARGVAVNLDPSSPTYWYGPFGPVPMFYSSPFLTTNAAAAKAAASLLKQQIGLPYQIDLEHIVNAALEPFDPIDVRYPKKARNRSLLTERHVIDELKIPLTHAQPGQLKTREQRVVMIGEQE